MSVVVSARDAAATIGGTLDGLLAQEDAPPFEVIIIDNGSNDTTADVIENHPLELRLIRRVRGDGVGVARNEGVAASRGRIIAITDADCVPAPGWLRAGVLAMEAADIVQGGVRPTPGQYVGPYDRTVAIGAETGFYETANLFVRREWFERVQGFSAWVTWQEVGSTRRTRVPDRPFGEDAWFAWEARRLGARVGFASDSIVHHVIFPGDVSTFVMEQFRLRHFPPLMARIPELRNVFAWHRYFLNARTAALDAAIVSVIAAAVVRSPIPLVAAVPYGLLLRREVGRFPLRLRGKARYAAAVVARDAVGLVALMRGSVRARTPLL